jgi:iron(III) transport system substrate-binding protein
VTPAGPGRCSPATSITPQLIEAAKKEGKVAYYTSVDLPIAERTPPRGEVSRIAVRSSAPAPMSFSVSDRNMSRIYAVDAVNSGCGAFHV